MVCFYFLSLLLSNYMLIFFINSLFFLVLSQIDPLLIVVTAVSGSGCGFSQRTLVHPVWLLITLPKYLLGLCVLPGLLSPRKWALEPRLRETGSGIDPVMPGPLDKGFVHLKRSFI